MQILFVVTILIIALLFGLSSMSQSYASAKQAQAVIEANRTAQIASAGNLIALVTITLIVVAALAIAIFITFAVMRSKTQPKRRWMSNSTDDFEFFPQTQARIMLPTILTMMMYQLMQEQQQRHQEVDQFFLINEPANDMPFFQDNTWDM